jgi:hypothetical protein
MRVLRWCVFSVLLASSSMIINVLIFLILKRHPAWASLFTEGQFFLLASGLVAAALSIIAWTEGWRRLRESVNGFSVFILTLAVAGFTIVATTKATETPTNDNVVIIMSVITYLAALVTSGLSVILAGAEDNGT